jgi:hypothetical protein
MGLFDFFLSRTDREFDAAPPHQLHELEIDLKNFLVGTTRIGSELSSQDFFTPQLKQSGQYGFDEVGIFLSVKDGVLDSAQFDLPLFPGAFTFGETKLNLTNSTTETDLLDIFGEPYWIDRDEDETILFYEYQGGATEIQFEIPKSQGLAVIILVAGGILSDPQNRKGYGVTKPWPPS